MEIALVFSMVNDTNDNKYAEKKDRGLQDH